VSRGRSLLAYHWVRKRVRLATRQQPGPAQPQTPSSEDRQSLAADPVRRRLARMDLARRLPLRHRTVRNTPTHPRHRRL